MKTFEGVKGPWLLSNTVLAWIIGGDKGSDICKISDHYGFDDLRGSDLANAKLIAAAPELLEALQELLIFCKSHNVDNFYTGQAEAVIDNILKP